MVKGVIMGYWFVRSRVVVSVRVVEWGDILSNVFLGLYQHLYSLWLYHLTNLSYDSISLKEIEKEAI